MVAYVGYGTGYDLEQNIKNMTTLRLPSLATAVGDTTLGVLRRTKKTILPEGLEIVGENWFAGSEVEEVTIPASAREIGRAAFRGCLKLYHVQFADGSVLEKIGAGAFYNTGLETFAAPNMLRTIAQGAFDSCKRLRDVVLNEGLRELGTDEDYTDYRYSTV